MSKGTGQFLAQSETFVAPVKSHFQACEPLKAKGISSFFYQMMLPTGRKMRAPPPSSSCWQGLQTDLGWLNLVPDPVRDAHET